MANDDRSPATLQFKDFRLDLRSLELRKHGLRVRLRRQPAQVLAFLAKHPGEIVPREDIQRQLWGTDTFVDFERGLNNCVKQIRQALNDTSENPKYIETIPRVGYRLLTEVRVLNGNRGNGSAAAGFHSSVGPEFPALQEDREPAVKEKTWKPRAIWIAPVFAVAAVLIIIRWG